MFGTVSANPYNYEVSTIGTECLLKSGNSLASDKENEGGIIPYVKVGDIIQ